MKTEKKQGLPKAFLMALMKVFHYTTSVMAFIAVWWFMYSGHGLENYQPNADYLVYFVYCISLYCLFRIYDVYNIGYARTTDNVFGQVLSDVISAGIIYVMMSILSGAILNPLALLGLGVFQGIWNIAWSKLTKEVYYKFYKRKRTVVVYRNRDDLQRVEEMRYLTRKFKIEKLVHNTHDDFRSLEPELEGFDAIIVAGVEASLRNGIAKYCIEKNVRGYFAPHVGDIIMQGAHHISSFRVPVMSVRRAFKNPFYLILKRLIVFYGLKNANILYRIYASNNAITNILSFLLCLRTANCLRNSAFFIHPFRAVSLINNTQVFILARRSKPTVVIIKHQQSHHGIRCIAKYLIQQFFSGH